MDFGLVQITILACMMGTALSLLALMYLSIFVYIRIDTFIRGRRFDKLLRDREKERNGTL